MKFDDPLLDELTDKNWGKGKDRVEGGLDWVRSKSTFNRLCEKLEDLPNGLCSARTLEGINTGYIALHNVTE